MAGTVVVTRKRGRRLRCAENVRAFVAQIIRRVERRDPTLTLDEARLLVNASAVLLKCIESDDARFDRKLKAHIAEIRELKRAQETARKAFSAAQDASE